MKVKVTDIKWETDGEEVDLPKEEVVEVDYEYDAAEALSEKYGWLVNSCLIEVLK